MDTDIYDCYLETVEELNLLIVSTATKPVSPFQREQTLEALDGIYRCANSIGWTADQVEHVLTLLAELRFDLNRERSI